nr:hypothetical protein [Tanacetum cinerariifolium]
MTDDFSRFTWTFFLRSKDETSDILKKFITKIENLKDYKVKIIRCDNGGEFRKKEMNDFCSQKGIKREFSNAKTPQQNGVAERRNRTLIEAARTMLADAKLRVTFWAEAVNTACYVQNRFLVNKSQNKTPYELFKSITPAIGFLKPFGCHVMILNTLDNLGKFKAKGDEGTNSTNLSGTKDAANQEVKKNESSLSYIVLPNWDHDALLEPTSSKPYEESSTHVPEGSGNPNPTASSFNPPADQFETLTVKSLIPNVSSPVTTACLNDSSEPSSEARLVSKRVANQEQTPSLDNILSLTNKFEDILGVSTSSDEIIRVEADVSNMETSISASPTPTLRIHKDHPKSQIIGPVDTPIQTRHKSKMVEEQLEPKKVFDALQDPRWGEAMQEELLQFKIQKVWILVDCPKGVRPIGTKWVLKNKKDERGIVVRFKARLVAQGHTQEEGIDYDEVFAPVARIEAIRLFLAYASFIGFTVLKRPRQPSRESKVGQEQGGVRIQCCFPPPAQVYSPPKKDLSCTGISEFADDMVTHYSRPSPAIETDPPTEAKSDKKEIVRKPSLKYVELYRKPTKRVDHGSSWAKKNNTYKSKSPRPKRTSFHKPAHSYNKRPFQRTSVVRSQFRGPRVATVNRKFPTVNRKLPTVNRKFPTGNTKFSTVDLGNKGKAVKGNSQNHIDDKRYWDSGCSWHMTGNISYLTEYEPYNGGYVSFGQCGCKITGKGVIKTECIVLGRNFKLTDDANVLLRTPRQHNMYTIDLNNIVPHKDLTCLVAKASADEVTDDFSRFTWTFFLKTKDETSDILRNFITKIENLKELRKGIKTEFSNARTPQQNGVAERRNETLIEAARTMLADAKLPVTFWLKQLTLLVMFKTGKFEAKGDEGYFLWYSMSSKAFRVFNKRTKRVEENLHVDFLENKLIEKGAGPNWLFDIDSLTNFMNYVPVVVAGINSTNFSGTKEAAGQDVKKYVSSLRYIVLPTWFHKAHLESSTRNAQDTCSADAPESSGNSNPTATSTNPLADHMETLAVETLIPTVSSPVPTACLNDSPEPSSDTRLISKRVTNQDDTPSLDNILSLTNRFKDIIGVTTNTDDTNGVEADLGNMETTLTTSPTPTLRIHKDHPKSQIIGHVDTPIQTRNKSKEMEERSFIATIHQKTNLALL